MLISMQRPTSLEWQQIFSMGSIIARFLKSVLLSKIRCTLTITSQIIMISHLASPLTASLLLKSRSILCGSSSFSTTISLQSNASERITFFVLGLYLVQKSHGTQTLSSICLCVNYSNSQSVCLHMMPSREAFLPSTPMSLLALVTFLWFPCLCTWKDTMACAPVKCAASLLFAPQTHKTRHCTCHCPTIIIPCQPILSSIVQKTYPCALMNTLWCRPKKWSLCQQNTVRGACKGVWDQRSSSSQCSWVSEVFPVISIQLHAFGLGKSYPKPHSLLVWPL